MTYSPNQVLAALDALLDHALAIDPAERGAWLAGIREEQPAMAAELELLLAEEAALDASGFLLDSPLVGTSRAEPSLAGRRIGAYTLARSIGQGGMGTVWLARRSDGRFEGSVAIKLLNLALLDPVGSERFRREGTVLARLSHPNIARLIDAGVTEDGQPYIVLEYVEGLRIDRYCDEQHLTPARRLERFLEVLGAVNHAHANLIVHRDIKPSNIIVATDGTVKLLDFGIAKLLEAESALGERSTLTDLGGSALTPEYAAPEQVSGGTVTTATDVYSLGVLLYVLLAGRHPTGEHHGSVSEHLRGILDTEPVRLSAAVTAGGEVPDGEGVAEARSMPIGRLRRLYAGDLENILAKSLKKKPEERYRTIGAFADDLNHYLRQEPVSARADSFAYRAGKFLRRHRVSVVAGTIAAAGLIGATAFSVAQMRESRRQRDAAVFEQKRADAQVEFQTLMLSSMGPERVTMREILDQGSVLLQHEYSAEAPLAASIALSLATAYQELGEPDRQLDLLTRAEASARAAGQADIVLVSSCGRAANLADRDSTAHATALADSVRPGIGHAAPRYAAACLSDLAQIEFRKARFDSTAALSRRAAAILEGAGSVAGMDYISVLNTEANALENLKRRREALAIYERLANVMDSSGRGQTSTRNIIRNNIGIALSNLGEMRAAEPVLQETLETFRRGDPGGNVHPAILINYCRTELFLHRLDVAAEWYERLYTQSSVRKDVQMEGDGAHGMAEVALARRQLNEAARWIEVERRVLLDASGPRPGTSIALDAALAQARGDRAKASTTFSEALRQLGYFDGRRTYQMRSVLVRAAEAARDSRDWAKAVEYARAAADIATSDSLSETRSAYVGEARLIEGSAILARGDTAAARAVIAGAAAALHYGAGADHPRSLEADQLLATISRQRPVTAAVPAAP